MKEITQGAWERPSKLPAQNNLKNTPVKDKIYLPHDSPGNDSIYPRKQVAPITTKARQTTPLPNARIIIAAEEAFSAPFLSARDSSSGTASSVSFLGLSKNKTDF